MEFLRIGTDKAQRDYQLLKDALENNNQKAYAELMDLYKNSLYLLLLKMMNNPEDAEDLTIETFGKAFKNLDKYSPEYAFSTWLYKIATNHCIDYMRKKNNKPYCVGYDSCTTDSIAEEYVRTTVPTPEDTVIAKQKAIVMRNLVQQLRPKYRQLIELRYFQELSYEEIAQKLEISLTNVKVQLFRAKEMLSNLANNQKDKI